MSVDQMVIMIKRFKEEAKKFDLFSSFCFITDIILDAIKELEAVKEIKDPAHGENEFKNNEEKGGKFNFVFKFVFL